MAVSAPIMASALLLLLLPLALAATQMDASGDDVAAETDLGPPFTLKLSLSVADKEGTTRSAQAGSSQAAAAVEAALEALAAAALNGSLAAARAYMKVQVVSREVQPAQDGALRRLRVELRGALPPLAALPPGARGWEDWVDDLDLSPQALANLLVEMAATLVGLSWGIYSMWLAG